MKHFIIALLCAISLGQAIAHTGNITICQATIGDGLACWREAQPGSKYCWAHQVPVPPGGNETQTRPPTFKTDWEDYYDLLAQKATALALPNADTIAIFYELDQARIALESKWDIDSEMQKAPTTWTGWLLCAANCTYTYYNCQKNPGQWVPCPGTSGDECGFYLQTNCMSVFQGCVYRNCN